MNIITDGSWNHHVRNDYLYIMMLSEMCEILYMVLMEYEALTDF